MSMGKVQSMDILPSKWIANWFNMLGQLATDLSQRSVAFTEARKVQRRFP